MGEPITCGHLDKVLAVLGFVETTIDGRWRAYQHAASGTLIVLANRDHTLPARGLDVASVRRHLVDRGLIEVGEFEGLLTRKR